MSLLNLAFGLFVIWSCICCIVHSNNCPHSESQTLPSGDDVELKINCSHTQSINVTYKYTSNGLPPEISIIYTCLHSPDEDPVQGTVFDGFNVDGQSKMLMNISCGSLCIFGGCYLSGSLGMKKRLSISPMSSCFSCNEENKLCGSCPRVEDNHCRPSLELGNGSLQCNCPPMEECTTTPPTTIDIQCTCDCLKFEDGYNCKCLNGSGENHCDNITECEVNICDDSMDCKDMQVPYNCFCKQITGHNNASYCININSVSLDTTISNYFMLAIILSVPLLLGVGVLILALLVYIKKSRRKDSRSIISKTIDEICDCDPVEVEIPKYQTYGFQSGSAISLFDNFVHPKQHAKMLLDSVDVLSSRTLQQSDGSSISSFSDSGYNLTDVDGYIDCSCVCSSSAISQEPCQYCQSLQS